MVTESFKSPSLAGLFVTFCDLKVLFFKGPPKNMLTNKKRIIGRIALEAPNFGGPWEIPSPYIRVTSKNLS
jgi:hypothetical protein